MSSIMGNNDTLLIASNSVYDERMTDIEEHNKINYILYKEAFNKIPDYKKIDELLKQNPNITHVSMVHSETTSCILNDIKNVGHIVKENKKYFIVDAMSSFGGMCIPVEEWGIDFIISSANKYIQGIPCFSFIIGKQSIIEQIKGNARSLSLDLYDQYKTMEEDGKWRFTSPTHTVLAFNKALDEMDFRRRNTRKS